MLSEVQLPGTHLRYPGAQCCPTLPHPLQMKSAKVKRSLGPGTIWNCPDSDNLGHSVNPHRNKAAELGWKEQSSKQSWEERAIMEQWVSQQHGSRRGQGGEREGTGRRAGGDRSRAGGDRSRAFLLLPCQL